MKRPRSLKQVSSMMKASTRGRSFPRITSDEEIDLASEILDDIPLEMKFLDLNFGTGGLGTGWNPRNPTATDCLNGVAQGDGESQRDGRHYDIYSLHINANFDVQSEEDAGGPREDFMVRLLIVLDTQTNGAELAGGDVMENGGPHILNGHKDLRHDDRFEILYDRTVVLHTRNTEGGSANEYSNGHLYFPFKIGLDFDIPIPVYCKGTGAGVENIVDNSLHMITSATSGDVRLAYTSRIRFRG